jgi:RNA polymerase primary sigma factor
MKEFKILTKYINTSSNLSRYYSDLVREDLLTPEEEGELAVRAKGGDNIAREKIIKANLRFAVSVAKSYTSNPHVLEDLISEGNKGLVEAIEKYDPTTGFKFISYAVWHIRKNILAYMNIQKSIRLPMNVVSTIKKYQDAVDKFISINDREPTFQEMEEIFDENGMVLPKNTSDAILNSPRVVPLEYDGDSENDELGFGPIGWLASEDPAPDHDIRVSEHKASIDLLMECLTPTEKNLIRMKYGLYEGIAPMEYKEIGSVYDRSAEWARLIILKAQRKMRRGTNDGIRNSLMEI